MKKIISIVLVIIMALSLYGCRPELGDIVGTWVGQYTYNGNSFHTEIVLLADGTYLEVTEKNGDFSSGEFGDYELDGKKLKLYNEDSIVYHGHCTEYTYRFGKFVNNGHEFSKVS